MRFYFKSRVFRFYLRVRSGSDGIATRIFACLARLATGIHILPEHVRKGMYNRIGNVVSLNVSHEKVTDETLALAKDLYDESRTRISNVAPKVSALLTVTSIAVSGTFASLSLIGIPSTLSFGIVFLITILVFLCTGWFLFKFLGVGRISVPALDQEFLDLEPAKKKAALVESFLSAIEQNDLRNNFLVDIYKAGRKLCALSFACALVLITFTVLSRGGREDRLLLKLRSNEQLIELLRGPKGAAGVQGMPGATGPVGPKGEKGDQGAKGDVYVPILDERCICPKIMPTPDTKKSHGELPSKGAVPDVPAPPNQTQDLNTKMDIK